MKLNTKQLSAMLRIQAAGRIDDPSRCALKLHHATRKALIARDMAFIGINGGLHLTNEGRRVLLEKIAGTVAPVKSTRPCLAIGENRLPAIPIDEIAEILEFPRTLFVQTSRARRKPAYSQHSQTVH